MPVQATINPPNSLLEEKTESSSYSEISDDMKSFKPPYIMGISEYDDEDKRVSLAILMLSGLLRRNRDHFVQVVDDGGALEAGFI